MFHNIPPKVQERMAYLEAIDAQDRVDGTPRLSRLRQIPPETGKFLALLAAGAPAGEVVEVGTSAGYSTLWLALACRSAGRRLTTFEILPDKVRMAQETIRLTDTADVIELVAGDALAHLPGFGQIAFCFLDAEKEIYAEVYDLVVPRLVPGGLIIADNAINHADNLAPMIEHALTDDRVDALVVPIGKGVLLCRKAG